MSSRIPIRSRLRGRLAWLWPALVACAAPLAMGACTSVLVSFPPMENGDRLWPATALTRHVVIVSADGLRPDAITMFEAPTLRRLMSQGSYTLAARTILPSKTLPSHTSMLTGEPPERHGVLWNTPVTGRRRTMELPTVFSVARLRGYRTAAFFSKRKFHAIQQPGTLDYSQAPGGWFGAWSLDKTTGDLERYLDGQRPNVLFVHFGEPDHAGHEFGWMSPQYGRAVTAADAAVARVMVAADRAFGAGNHTVIVTSDHGGHDRDHGSDDPRDVTIPWIAWGRGVKAGVLGAEVRVSIMDTASTALWLLGLEEPSDWAGTPVGSAFEQR